PEDIQERLAQITGREEREVDVGRDGPGRGRDRLREALDRGSDGLDASKEVEKRSIRERLDHVLNKPRERLEIENETQKEREIKNEREIDRTVERDRGLSR
ncbi:hypothetical protein, partial [Roseibium polysiphoniae]|uniref:hypothetical protein n=1 Tax=Roseibium polysiphoniae TaxID=2571221 RepID=UPI00329735C6